MDEKKNGDGARRPQLQSEAPQGSVVTTVYHSPTNGSNGGASPCRGQWSEQHGVTFPAVLVMGRWNSRTGEPFAAADNKRLWSDVDVARRFGMYGGLEASGALPYWWMVEEERLAGALAEELRAQQDECAFYDALFARGAVQLGV